ncbi:MAG: sigma-70 family RNA polymerase sigma factor, partial [Mucilaginibacter sp.]
EIYDNLADRLQTPESYNDIEYKELMMQVSEVVSKLPEKCREIYKLSREGQLSHKQIAEQLNISTKTVENHLTKALRYLRTSLSATVVAVLFYFFVR